MITIKSRTDGTRETLALKERTIDNDIYTDEWLANQCIREGLKYIAVNHKFDLKKKIVALDPLAGYGILGKTLDRLLPNIEKIDFVEINTKDKLKEAAEKKRMRLKKQLELEKRKHEIKNLEHKILYLDELLSKDFNKQLRSNVEVGDYWGQDFFKWYAENCFNRYDLIVCNPPFTPVNKISEPVLINCLDLLKDDGFVFYFMSMAFVNNGDQRMERLAEKIDHFYCLPRIAFKGQSNVHSTFFIASNRPKKTYNRLFIIPDIGDLKNEK